MYTKRFKPKRIHSNVNVQTRKLYDSISHKLGKPTFQVKPPPYMRDWKPISRKRDWRLDTVRNLGICIMCHGNIGYNSTHPILDIPDRVTIHKKNLGGCGNQSYGLYKLKEYVGTVNQVKDTSKPINISHKVKQYVDDYTTATLTHFDRCIDKPSYNKFASVYIENPFPSCEMFHGPRFYSKLYTFKPYETKTITYTNNYIMFIYLHSSGLYKRINIVTCTQDELNDFFGDVDAPITTEFMKTKQDRIQKKRLTLSTEDIFKLIEHARDTLDITNVNILDLSCNTHKPFRRNPDIGY